jgi:hypothetical protein
LLARKELASGIEMFMTTLTGDEALGKNSAADALMSAVKIRTKPRAGRDGTIRAGTRRISPAVCKSFC